MSMEQHPSMDELEKQVIREGEKLRDADNEATLQLLNELEKNPRKLNSAEISFLETQLHTLNAESGESDQDGVYIDVDKIKAILEENK